MLPKRRRQGAHATQVRASCTPHRALAAAHLVSLQPASLDGHACDELGTPIGAPLGAVGNEEGAKAGGRRGGGNDFGDADGLKPVSRGRRVGGLERALSTLVFYVLL